jgi:hypothetical protein
VVATVIERVLMTPTPDGYDAEIRLKSERPPLGAAVRCHFDWLRGQDLNL